MPTVIDFDVQAGPYRPELLVHCYRMLGSVHEAEDLVQETMLRAWRAWERYDDDLASLRTWLYKIATNVCLTALRGRAHRPLPSGLGGPSGEPDDNTVKDTIERYIRAFEAADVATLVSLLTEDAIQEMPPIPLWLAGREDYGRFIERVFAVRGTHWRMFPISANAQPAVAAYCRDDTGTYRLHTLQVFTVTTTGISHDVVFQVPEVFAAFGLTTTLDHH